MIKFFGYGIIPKGMIMTWSGNIANIPKGWALCNGSNGTPDLTDRFLVGAAVDIANIPRTTLLGLNASNGGTATHYHTNVLDIYGTTGGDDVAYNYLVSSPCAIDGFPLLAGSLPPFFALAYIMKL